jgi:hypothetical protein
VERRQLLYHCRLHQCGTYHFLIGLLDIILGRGLVDAQEFVVICTHLSSKKEIIPRVRVCYLYVMEIGSGNDEFFGDFARNISKFPYLDKFRANDLYTRETCFPSVQPAVAFTKLTWITTATVANVTPSARCMY